MEAPKSDHLTSILLVNNIHCPSCVSYAEDVLRPLSDVGEVTISIISHEIRLQHHRVETASAAIRELLNAAFEVQHIETTDVDGTIINDHEVDGGRSNGPVLYTWPLFTSRAQRKHIKNCSACRTKADNQPKRAKIWAAIRGRDKFVDVEKQDSSRTHVDGPASKQYSVRDVDDPESPAGQGSSEYVASVSIGGMTCASCSGSITKELEALYFVTNVNINLLTNNGNVTFHGPRENSKKIIESIEDIGYEATVDEIKPHVVGDHSKPLSHKFVASLSIQGMTCGSCVGTITEGLQALSFVHQVDIDLIGNSGKVVFDGRENIDKIQEKLDDLAYNATVVELKRLDDAQPDSEAISERTITIAVEGMYCQHCPENIMSSLRKVFGHSIIVEEALTLQMPRIRIRYTPSSPHLTVRKIVSAITSSHEAFTAKIWHPPSIEERSRAMQHQEQRRILARLIFTFLVAIPTLVIGVIYMSLVPANDSTKMWFEERVWAGNVSRTEWALFIMTTPVMLFGADVFHTRAFKELKALWRPGSKVPILRRFYRFGSMNLLISAGTSVAYFSSVAVLILDARATPQSSMGSHSSTYFDSVTFLSFFILIGKYLEAYSKAKTGDTVAMLSKLRPDEALLVESASKGSSGLKVSGSEVLQHVQIDELEVGDTVKILHGVSPPTDGVVISPGTFAFDESSLTGESKPVKKVAGDQIFAGSVNVSQSFDAKVTSIGGTSMLDKIVAIVREGQTKRAPIERFADTITAYFVPVITLLAIITFVVWLSLGLSGALPERYLNNAQGGWAFWSLEFAIAVFVVACPCGLGLAAPTALFVGGGLAAKHGILVRGGGEAFQEASRLDVIVFDKTGTLTEGQMKVTDYEMLRGDHGKDEEQALVFALSKAMEGLSTHPIATAISDYCTAQDLQNILIAESDITEIPGQGVRGKFTVQQEGHQEDILYEAAIGNQRLFSSLREESGKAENQNIYLETTLTKFQTLGQSTAIFSLRRLLPSNSNSNSSIPPPHFHPLAIFAISDPIRPSTPSVLSNLRTKHKLQIHMCTGDNPTTAHAIASQLGIPTANVRAGVMPMEKAEYIRELQNPQPLQSEEEGRTLSSRKGKQGKSKIVAFVGDGTNDTPALSAASVSIALSSGSDIAISTSSFILLNHSTTTTTTTTTTSSGADLTSLLILVSLSRRVFTRVKYNFVWAAVYNLLLVPVAAGVFFRLGDLHGMGQGWRLGPVWASAAMALSSISVVCSSLALKVPPIKNMGGGTRNKD